MISAADVALMQTAVDGAGYFSTPCQVQRGPDAKQVSPAGLGCHIVPGSGAEPPMPAMRLAGVHPWSIRLPLGTDVQPGDQIIAAGQAYTVDEVIAPQSVAVYLPCRCLKVGPVAGDGTITPTYLQPNATITISRRGGTVPAGGAHRRVRLEDPSPDQQPLPGGPQVALLLYDQPGADYRQADVVEIVQVDGFTGVPSPNKYSVGEVDFVPAPWPLVRIQLTGTSRGGNL
jgi:hypothetical protein